METQICLEGGRKWSEETWFLYSCIFCDSWGSWVFPVVMWIPLYSLSIVFCAVLCHTKSFLSFCLRSLRLKGHRGSVWKVEVMLHNPLLQYTGMAHSMHTQTLIHMVWLQIKHFSYLNLVQPEKKFFLVLVLFINKNGCTGYLSDM